MTGIGIQKQMKLGKDTGSLMNHLMSVNKTLPEVGKGATILQWSDREAYEVMDVSADGKTVILQKYNAKRIDTNGMSESQEYEYTELLPHEKVIVWRNGAWRWSCQHIEWDKKYYAEFEKRTFGVNGGEYKKICEEMIDPFFDENGNLMLVEGKTKIVKSFPKVNILWGVKDEYYDYSF